MKNSYLNLNSDLRRHFSFLANFIKDSNKDGYTDINKLLEKYFIPVFNCLYNAQFKLVEKSNHPAIDLYFEAEGIGLQVSSLNNLSKIKNTFLTLFKNEKEKQINKIDFFFLTYHQSLNKKENYKKINDYLNKPEIISEINKSRKNTIKDIMVDNFIDITLDIKCFNDIIKESEYIDKCLQDKYDKNLLELIEDLLPELNINPNEINQLILKSEKSINDEITEMQFDEVFNYLNKKFSPLKIYPKFVLQFIKANGKNIFSYFNNFHIYTDNSPFFEFIKSENDKKQKKINSSTIDFLLSNNIFTIANIDRNQYISINRDNWGELHKTTLNCVNFKIEKPKEIFNSVNDFNIYQKINSAFEFGDFGNIEKSISIYKELLNFVKDKDNAKVAYFITLYNLRKTKNNLSRESKVLLDDIERELSINYRNLFSINLNYEESRIIDYIFNYNHIDDLLEFIKVQKKSEEFNNSLYNIQNNLKPIIDNWIYLILNKIDFVLSNNILFDLEYSNFKNQFKKAFTEFHNLIRKYDYDIKFESDIIYFYKFGFIYLSPPELEKIISINRKSVFYKEYNLKILHSEIKTNLQNLRDGAEILNVTIPKDKVVYYGIKTRINDFLSNCYSLYKILNFKQEDLNDFIQINLEIISKVQILHFRTLDNFIEMIQIIQFKINNKFKIGINEILKKNIESYSNRNFISEIFLSKAKLRNTKLKDYPPDYLYDLWLYRRNELDISEFKKIFIEKLNNEFDSNIFLLAILNGVIEFNDILFLTFVEEIKAKKAKIHPQFYNWHLNKLIEISFKFDIDLKKYDQLFCEENEYFIWLRNLDKFDYSKFDVKWLLEYNSIIYYNKFAKSPKIKKSLVEYLKTNDNLEIMQIYFRFFT